MGNMSSVERIFFISLGVLQWSGRLLVAGIVGCRHCLGKFAEGLTHAFFYHIVVGDGVANENKGNEHRFVGFLDLWQHQVAVEAISFANAAAHEHAVNGVANSLLGHRNEELCRRLLLIGDVID